VGYGDKKPETLEGRMFAIFFVLMGFSTLAYGFSLAASFALEKAESMKAKHETRVTRLLTKVADIRLSVSFSSLKQRLGSKPASPSSSPSSSLDVGDIQQLRRNQGSEEDDHVHDLDDDEEEDEDNAMLRDLEGQSSSFSSVSQLSEAYRKSFEYETYKLKRRCVRNLLLVSGFVLGAALVMMAQEGWTFSDALYWAVVTITTVGYGGRYWREREGGGALCCDVL
jgi:hypothetical protein